MFEVIVGNLGTVLTTDIKSKALNSYHSYVRDSKCNYGRVAGESVTLFENGEPINEYDGSNSLQETDGEDQGDEGGEVSVYSVPFRAFRR